MKLKGLKQAGDSLEGKIRYENEIDESLNDVDYNRVRDKDKGNYLVVEYIEDMEELHRKMEDEIRRED